MQSEAKGGVLIVGSLLWDRDDPVRVEWRNNWLDCDQALHVSAPIRYGRVSRKRGCTYTMVFSRLCLRRAYGLGTAVVVPLHHRMGDAVDLLEAAHALWGAELKSTNHNRRLGSSWGGVGILFNPSSPSQELPDAWRQTRGDLPIPTHSKSEGPVIDAEGRLRLPWPRTPTGELLDLDFLLATPTDPELIVPGQRYPSAERIAAAWIGDWRSKKCPPDPMSAQVKYFLKNRQHGIETFQDDRIREYLKREGIESV